MANSLQVIVVEDGPRNAIVRIEGDMNTADLAYQPLIMPSTLGFIDTARQLRASQLRVNTLDWSVQGAQFFQVRLWWDNATAANSVRMWDMIGRSNVNFEGIGGLTNTQLAGFTGGIGISTQGWSSESADCAFSVILKIVKQYQGV